MQRIFLLKNKSFLLSLGSFSPEEVFILKLFVKSEDWFPWNFRNWPSLNWRTIMKELLLTNIKNRNWLKKRDLIIKFFVSLKMKIMWVFFHENMKFEQCLDDKFFSSKRWKNVNYWESSKLIFRVQIIIWYKKYDGVLRIRKGLLKKNSPKIFLIIIGAIIFFLQIRNHSSMKRRLFF